MTESPPTDRELLTQHATGDRDAFGELVRRHRDRMWRVALRTLGNQDDAADALQDALLSAYRGAAGYRGDAQVTTWLHRIVVNRAIDWSRARTLRRELSADAGAEPAAAEREPGGRAEELATALAELGAEHRAVIVLRYLLDYTPGEIAELLDLPRGTVNSRLRRGLDRLEQELRQ